MMYPCITCLMLGAMIVIDLLFGAPLVPFVLLLLNGICSSFHMDEDEIV